MNNEAVYIYLQFQLKKIYTIYPIAPAELLTLGLRGRKNVWIKELKSLTPYGLKQELN